MERGTCGNDVSTVLMYETLFRKEAGIYTMGIKESEQNVPGLMLVLLLVFAFPMFSIED